MSSILSSPSVLAVNCSTTLKPMQSRNADLQRQSLALVHCRTRHLAISTDPHILYTSGSQRGMGNAEIWRSCP